MTRKRAYIPLPESLAAARACLLPQEVRDDLRARKVPCAVVNAMFTDDHNELHALAGEDRWWNLTPMLRPEHKEKSRRDTSIVAKVRRIQQATADHIAIIDAKATGTQPPERKRSRIPQRVNAWGPKGARKIQSRGFQRRRT